jgi:putative effector of murein hydrolase LrgA (UPF0299 family)
LAYGQHVLKTLTILLIYQLAGETAAVALGLPVPGPVLGMLMLLATMVVRGNAPAYLREGAQGLLTHLSLLFVPAGVGVVAHIARIEAEFWPIVISLIGSTALTIAVTALVIERRRPPQGEAVGTTE